MSGLEKTYNTAIYCRLSKDDDQLGESVSIETQKMILTDFCEEHQFKIHDYYVDDGFSGLNFNRPAFSRLMHDINAGLIDLVITKDLSRLGRDYIQTGYLTEIYFNQKQVRYIAVNDGIDTLRDNNDIAPFKNILNDMYAKDLSRKIKTAKRQRAHKGYFVSSQTPYGYKVDSLNPNHLVIDEEAVAVVRKVFDLAEKGYTYSYISRVLTKEQIPTPGAHKLRNGDARFMHCVLQRQSEYAWVPEVVRSMVRNPIYTGSMVNHKTEVINYKTKQRVPVPRDEYIIVPNMHEPIISQEFFDKVQEVIKGHTRASNHQFENVFKGHIFCAECRSPLLLIAKKNRNGSIIKPSFICDNHRLNPDQCTHYRSIYYDELRAEVMKSLKKILSDFKDSESYQRLLKKFEEQEKEQQIYDEKAEIFRELSSLRKKIAELRKQHATADSLYCADALNDLFQQQQQLTQRLTELELGNIEFDPSKTASKLDEFLAGLCSGGLTENLIHQFIDRIEIGETVRTEEGPRRTIYIKYKFNP